MKKILVSACLLGQPVRYNGAAKPLTHPALERWQAEGRVVAICPELAAGLSTPRPPAEIATGANGADVLADSARVLTISGMDVTELYIAGAKLALALAQCNACAFALLTDGSPSCGSSAIHDGSFTGKRHAGSGVSAALLQQHGIEVFPEARIDDLETLTS